MKKGRKYHRLRIKCSTVFHSGFIKPVLGFVFLTVISLGSAVGDIISLILYNSEPIKNYIDLGVSALSLAVSITGAVSSIKILKADCFHRQILNNTDYKQQVQQVIIKNTTAEYRKSKYKWANYNGQYYLYSDEVDKALSERADTLLLMVSKNKQNLSSEQQQAVFKIVNDKVAQGKNIFDSELVRLRTDLLLDGVLHKRNNIFDNSNTIIFKDIDFIKVDKTSYFYNITTNDLIYSRLFKSDFSSVYCCKNMTTDNDYNLYNLSQSPAANIIGISTMAITNDGFLVINKQNNNNDVNNNSYVPSGSGSSDFADLKQCRKFKVDDLLTKFENELKGLLNNYSTLDLSQIVEEIISLNDVDGFNSKVAEYKRKEVLLKDKKIIENYVKKMKKYTYSFASFIKYGMVRELMEESHIYANTKEEQRNEKIKNCINNTKIYGYIRILDRGGKPDFFGVTFLQEDRKAVKDAFDYGRINVTKTELMKGCPITDYNEACKQIYIEISDVFKCKNSDNFLNLIRKADTGIGVYNGTKMSLQLNCLFNLIKNNETEIKNFLA